MQCSHLTLFKLGENHNLVIELVTFALFGGLVASFGQGNLVTLPCQGNVAT